MPNTIQTVAKNYNIANKFRQNPRQHVYCFGSKMTLRSFTFNNSAILPRGDNGAVVNVEITYTGEITSGNWTLISIAVPDFDLVLKKLWGSTFFYFRR